MNVSISFSLPPKRRDAAHRRAMITLLTLAGETDQSMAALLNVSVKTVARHRKAEDLHNNRAPWGSLKGAK